MCSVTIKKTGKQIDLGLLKVISALCLLFYDWKFLGTFLRFRLLAAVKQFCENTNSVMVIQPKSCKLRYFFPSHLFIFYSLAQPLGPTVKLNGVSQPISIEYKMVHGFNQTVFRSKISKNFFRGFVQFSAVYKDRSQMLH